MYKVFEDIYGLPFLMHNGAITRLQESYFVERFTDGYIASRVVDYDKPVKLSIEWLSDMRLSVVVSRKTFEEVIDYIKDGLNG